MYINRAGLIKRPDLAEIGDDRGIGGIDLPVAGRNLEPVADLQRAEPGFVRRRLGAHDEDVGAESRIRGEKVVPRRRTDPARPEKRLASRMEEEDQRAVPRLERVREEPVEDAKKSSGPRCKHDRVDRGEPDRQGLPEGLKHGA